MRKIAFIACAAAAALALTTCTVATLSGSGTGGGTEEDPAEKVCTLTINPRNGEDPQTQEVNVWTTITLPEIPDTPATPDIAGFTEDVTGHGKYGFEYYEFLGWYDAATDETYLPGREYFVEKDTTFTGQWAQLIPIVFRYPEDDPRPEVHSLLLIPMMSSGIRAGTVYILPEAANSWTVNVKTGTPWKWQEGKTREIYDLGGAFTVPVNLPFGYWVDFFLLTK